MGSTVDNEHLIKRLWLSKNYESKRLLKMFLTEHEDLMMLYFVLFLFLFLIFIFLLLFYFSLFL